MRFFPVVAAAVLAVVAAAPSSIIKVDTATKQFVQNGAARIFHGVNVVYKVGLPCGRPGVIAAVPVVVSRCLSFGVVGCF
jgi:hypothetical protein